MVDNRIIEEWLNKAEEDFGFATSAIEHSPYYAQICFHYHQSAEKYLKAFIIANELDFRKIHDLIELLNICRLKEPSLTTVEEDCNFLNRFYIDTRYPVHWPIHYTKTEALNAKDAVINISDVIKKLIRRK